MSGDKIDIFVFNVSLEILFEVLAKLDDIFPVALREDLDAAVG